MTLVYVALFVASIGWGWQIAGYAKRKAKEKQDAIAECAARGHYWKYLSAYDEGRTWIKSCPNCPIQNVFIALEDVPDEDLRAFRMRNEKRAEKRARKKKVAGL